MKITCTFAAQARANENLEQMDTHAVDQYEFLIR